MTNTIDSLVNIDEKMELVTTIQHIDKIRSFNETPNQYNSAIPGELPV
jgi:hypothetical protein